MKNLILSIVAFISFSGMVSAKDPSMIRTEIKNIDKQESTLKKEKKEERKELRKLAGQEVSTLAKEQFKTDFANITDVKWKRSHYFDEATFKKDGKLTVAYYDDLAKLVGISTDASFAELPQKAQKYINEKYGDYTKAGVIFFDDNEFNETDMLLYGIQFDDQDSYFIELVKNNVKTILRISSLGGVTYFTSLK